jgi:hypothetical protein
MLFVVFDAILTCRQGSSGTIACLPRWHTQRCGRCQNSRYLHGQTRALPLSSTTCSARTSPSTILRHRPRSPAPERSSGLKRYSPDIHIPTYPIHSTGYLERPTHFQRYGRSRLSRLSRKRPMTAPRKLARKYGPNLLRHIYCSKLQRVYEILK